MGLKTAGWWLAGLWILACAVMIIFLVFQTLNGFYGENGDQVWEWFLPTVMPTLSLIVGVLVADRSSEETITDRRLFWMAFGLSFFYLVLVAVSIVSATVQADRVSPVDILRRSGMWLGPIQGLVAASVGIFFHKSD